MILKNNKMIVSFIAFVFMLMMGLPSKQTFANSDILLTELKPSDYSGYFYTDKWDYYTNFTDVFGNIQDTGIGLYAYNGQSFAVYNIDQMGFKSFQAKVTLDSQWLVGDYGKSAISFYADDLLLYEKQIPKNQVLDVNLKLPEKVKNFYIKVSQLKGAKGVQKVVIANGKFSSAGEYLNTSETTTSLQTIGAIDRSSYYYHDDWSNLPFQDINDNIITEGIGLYDYNGGTGYAEYNIDQMGYNIFESKITLDSKWIQGDFGKTAVGIYADDYLLYEKQLSAKTPVQTVRLHIPKGTKNLKLVTKHLAGARGEQKVVFINPVVKRTKESLKSVNRTVSVHTVGAIDNSSYYYKNSWNSDEPFRYVNGDLATSGIGLSTDSGGESYAIYDIQNMGFNAFKANLSLDSKWLHGDYGTSSVFLYADNKLLYSKSLTKTSGTTNLTLRLPSTTKKFMVLVKQNGGAKGTHGVVLGNAVFAKLPVSSMLKTSQVKVENNKGKNDKVTVSSLNTGDYIKVYNSKGTLLATSAKATKNGTSVSVSIKQLGTSSGKILVSRTSSNALESDKLTVSFKAEPK